MHRANSKKPLIVLIAANDQDAYLSQIPIEIKRLEKQLEPLCEKLDYTFKSFSYTKIVDFIDFLNRNKQNLLMLHFAGHASSDVLHLDEGEAHISGLSKKLAACTQLQIVFLNGCNTAKQVHMFSEVGVPTIIGTNAPIDDHVAGRFSNCFYKALGQQGLSASEAFSQAVEDIEAETGKTYRSFRSIKVRRKKFQSKFEWFVKTTNPKWTLADGSHPCNQLPTLTCGELPTQPFKNLYYYREQDAELFFGRCQDIVDLFALIKKPEPIILLHGGTGVGKSSFLQAGLMPRIKSNGQQVRYFRYNELVNKKDLVIQLFGSQQRDVIFQQLHSKTDDPTVWIIDQLEEIFFDQSQKKLVNNIPEELHQLLSTLNSIFYPSDSSLQRPNAKLIFSLRTEWYGQLHDACGNSYALNHQDYLLKILNKQSIMEVVESLSQVDSLKTRYQLDIINPEGGRLAEKIANDLLEDEQSHIAPILQITLYKLWKKVENKTQRQWNLATYLELKKQGLLLADYLEQQFNATAEKETWGKEAKNSGLMLDILFNHTTGKGTAKTLNKKEYDELYNHISYRQELLESLKDHHLIIEIPFIDQENNKQFHNRIAHDSIAKIIREKFNTSQLSGQKARRILNEKKTIWENTDRSEQKKILFDHYTLKLIKKGSRGTSDWQKNKTESFIINKSKYKNIRSKSFLYTSSLLMILLVLLFVAIAYEIEYDEKKIE